jgi:hypothetical protein
MTWVASSGGGSLRSSSSALSLSSIAARALSDWRDFNGVEVESSFSKLRTCATSSGGNSSWSSSSSSSLSSIAARALSDWRDFNGVMELESSFSKLRTSATSSGGNSSPSSQKSSSCTEGGWTGANLSSTGNSQATAGRAFAIFSPPRSPPAYQKHFTEGSICERTTQKEHK